ncbi:MAG: methyltransferase domain-containing protein [Phycisphaerales bacterium]|nr:methyltransferase domain-containing protein [Phycisphaerales bacterium]
MQNTSNNSLFPPNSGIDIAACQSTIGELIRQAMSKTPVTESAIESTIRVNTTGMSDRIKNIIELLNIKEGDTIGDFGCGYGFMPILLHAAANVKVDAFDRSNSFLDLGRSFASSYPKQSQGVTFICHDYLNDTISEDHGPYDVILMNNTLQYVVGNQNKLEVIRQLSSRLKPGGSIMIFGPNPWYPREPFTRLLMIQWLPRKLSKALTTRLKRRDLSDIHYSSYPSLRKLSRRAGLARTRYHPNGNRKTYWSDGILRKIVSPIFCRSFALVGRAPLSGKENR